MNAPGRPQFTRIQWGRFTSRFLKIVVLAIGAAIFYGIVHDMVTAHICVEYFSIWHPRVIDSDSPIALALVWGVLATWWMGAMFGIALATAAQAGRWPKQTARQLMRPIAVVLSVAATGAVIAGAFGCFAASRGLIDLHEPMASRIPAEWQIAFLADLWAHKASYLLSFIGGVWLIVAVVRRRRSLLVRMSTPQEDRHGPG